MRSLRITATAYRDLEAISEYFLESSVDAGDRFVQTFNKKCQHLARFPQIGKSYARLRPGLRGLLLMDYIVFYQVVENDVEILRVISGYRDLRGVFPNS
jgi:toxin ParE1/3/4